MFILAAAAFLHEAADQGRLLLLLRGQGIALGLHRTAVGVEADDVLDNGARVKILDGKLADHVFRIVAKQFECKHNLLL